MGSSRATVAGHMTDILFTLALFCVFAASAMLVVVIGARVYENTTRGMDRNFDMRTSTAYVTTKIRQFDRAGAVGLQPLGDGEALVLEQVIGEREYQTWIYHYDGALRELMIVKGSDFTVQDGQSILAIPDFQVEQAGENLLRLRSTDADGVGTEVLVALRSEA